MFCFEHTLIYLFFKEKIETQKVQLSDFLSAKFIITNSPHDVIKKSSVWAFGSEWFNLSAELKEHFMITLGRHVLGIRKFCGVKSTGRKKKFVSGLKISRTEGNEDDEETILYSHYLVIECSLSHCLLRAAMIIRGVLF